MNSRYTLDAGKRAALAAATMLALGLAACGGGSPDSSSASSSNTSPPPTALSVDTTPPTTPDALEATPTSATLAKLTWGASSDDVGVTGYQVFRDGVMIGLAPADDTAYTDARVSPNTAYSYQVRAVDAAGNVSNASAAAQVTTPPDPFLAAAETRSVFMIHMIYADTPPCFTDTAQMQKVFFDDPWSVKNFFLESSNGKFGWTGDVFMCRVNYASTDTTHDAAEDCQAQARSQGFEPDNYDVLGTISNVDGGGGSSGRRAGAETCDLSFIMHELGHQAGLGHASSDWGNNGIVDEYGDNADVMGWGWFTFNAPHRVQRGWLAQTTIGVDGSYALAPVEASSGVRAYKIIPPSGDPYFLGYYQPIGYDAQTLLPDGTAKPGGAIGSIPYTAPYTSGLNIYRHDGSGNTRLVAQITDGQSYGIPGTQAVIRQVSHDGQGVAFTVTGLGAP